MSLAARYLEANGIPTVVVGSARDIVEQAAVARCLFTDFPLGNPTGAPYDPVMQSAIVAMALDLLERAWRAQTTVQTSFHWPTDEWRTRFMEVSEANAEALRQLGAERLARQTLRKQKSRAGN